MKRIINFLILFWVKVMSRLFYKVDHQWMHSHKEDPWQDVRLVVILNHTSLYEPLFLGAAPVRLLWRMAGHLIVPIAAETMKRPLAGSLFRLVTPKVVPISRKRDETWDHFKEVINKADALVAMLPEGRMKRPNGLDKHGNPMTVRAGIVDVLELYEEGKMVFAYSGGLHHVQVPGQWLPKPFKRIEVRTEKVDIPEYMSGFSTSDERQRRIEIVKDIQRRLEENCPT